MRRPSEGAGRLGAAGFPQGTNSTPIVAQGGAAGKQADALTRLGEMIEAAKKAGVVRTGPDKTISSKEEPIRQQLSDLGIDKKVSR